MRSTKHIPWPRKIPSLLFSHEVSLITDYKLLVVILMIDIASLAHRLQRMLLIIHEYNIQLNKPGAQLYITDWLSILNSETEMKKSRVCVLPSLQMSCTQRYETA